MPGLVDGSEPVFGNSHQVASNQDGPHEQLAAVVTRHLAHPWRAPVAAHTRAAFAEAACWRAAQGADRPLVLDSGCGTGRSSVWLAGCDPEALVIGLDQSGDRLRRGHLRFDPLPANLLLLRAEAADFWRLAVEAGWRVREHCLFYPNPWPKSAHLRRRWHGHPVFPSLLQLGGRLRLRSNWPVYLEEMRLALAVAGRKATVTGLPDTLVPVTDFEEKYHASAHPMGELLSHLEEQYN